MKIIKKIYCRAFQLGFRIALPILPYRDPKILHHMEEIPALLERLKFSKPFLVTDKGLNALGMTKSLERLLADCGKTAVVYAEVDQNPTTDMVENARTLYLEKGCDCILAFGGGSPMDCAKAMGARIVKPKMPLYKMAGILHVRKKLPTLIAIPTTAGTGSETTLASVIVDGQTRHKYVINDFSLIPHYAVLDPVNIRSLPQPVAAATGMDALTHAIEAYIGQTTTKQTRADALHAVELIFTHLEAAANHTSKKAESEMLWASHLAGRAFTRSYVGYVHAVSHSLSGKYNMPHGLTNAVLLPKVLEMYGKTIEKKLAILAVHAGIGLSSEADAELSKRFIDAIYAMNRKLGIPDKLDGIRPQDIPELAAYADHEANPLYPVPRLWDKEELKEIYRKAGVEYETGRIDASVKRAEKIFC